jgi:uncharacterized protein (TIGR00369 family)
VDVSRIEHLAALASIRAGTAHYNDAPILCRGCAADGACRLGVELRRTADGAVEGSVRLPDWCEGAGGTSHGGYVMAVLDETAAALHTSAGVLGVTRRLDTRFHRPVPVGEPLVVEGRTIEADGRETVVEARVVDAAGRLLAEARGEFVTRDPLRHYAEASKRVVEDRAGHRTDGTREHHGE